MNNKMLQAILEEMQQERCEFPFYGNWHNWHNWHNWGNWHNWHNWGNWHNGPYN